MPARPTSPSPTLRGIVLSFLASTCATIEPVTSRIPAPLVAVLGPALGNAIATHAALESAFFAAGAMEPVPDGSMTSKAITWLHRTNKEHDNPLGVAGELLGQILETDLVRDDDRAQLEKVLARVSLRYHPPGVLVAAGVTLASKTLGELIKGRDWQGVEAEFTRALAKIETEPAEAVSAACNIVESLLKTYIEDEGRDLPSKKDISGLWDAAKRHLGFDPSALADADLKMIVGGLGTVASGIGALRTHASSAHGQGRKVYRLAPRHARLAVNAAHTIATFVIETWDAKRGK